MSFKGEICQHPSALKRFLNYREGDLRAQRLVRNFKLFGLPGLEVSQNLPSASGEGGRQVVVFEVDHHSRGEPPPYSVESGIGEDHRSKRYAQLYFRYGEDKLPRGLKKYGERYKKELQRIHPLLFKANIQRGLAAKERRI